MVGTLQLVACLIGPFALAATAQYNILTFHGDAQRTGWIPNETILTPRSVSSGVFGPLWNSPRFDSITVNGKIYHPHLYASPLYVDRVTVTGGAYAGGTFHVVYAASSNGFVYAVNASRPSAPGVAAPGAILWKRRLNTPGGSLDGGVALGILSTPVIDLTWQAMYLVAETVEECCPVIDLRPAAG